MFVGIVFLLFSLLYPLDYYIEMPGGAYDIRSVLTVDNKEDDEDGSYNLWLSRLVRRPWHNWFMLG